MLQPRLVDELLVAVLQRTFHRWFHVVEDVNAEQVIADLELPGEAFRAVRAFLKKFRIIKKVFLTRWTRLTYCLLSSWHARCFVR